MFFFFFFFFFISKYAFILDFISKLIIIYLYIYNDVAHVNGSSDEFDVMACLLSLTIYKILNERKIVIYHWRDCENLYSMIYISTKS